MKNLKKLLITAFVVGITCPAWAVNDAGLPGEFLNHGVGGRPLGMGRAYTAVVNDIDALFWNPAGLSTFRSNQVTFQHSQLILGGAYQYLAYAQPLYAKGNLGVGAVNLTSGKVPRVDDNNIEVGDFENRETAYLISYAHKMREKWNLGGTVKMAEKTIDGRLERGFGADVGALSRLNERVSFGVMVRNIVPPAYSFDSEKEKFPVILRAGSAVRFFDGHLLAALDLQKTIGAAQNPKPHLGLEGYVIDNVFLRMGIDQTEITGGMGLRWKTMQFDYAAGMQDAGFVNRVSMKFFFGGYEVNVKASPRVFSPVGLKNKTIFKISTTHRDRVVRWIMTVRNAQSAVVRSFTGFNAPPTRLEWDGRDENGETVPAGEYTYRLSVTDVKNNTETTPGRYVKIVSPTPMEFEAR